MLIVKPLGGLYRIIVKGIGTYYGESDNIPRRFRQHRKLLHNRRHHCIKLRKAYIALGPSAFTFEIIEQSEELTASKALRQIKEKLLIDADPFNLNTAASKVEEITDRYMPNQDRYRNQPILQLKRKGKSGIVEVRDSKGRLLGVEMMQTKFRAGCFSTDDQCRLTRLNRCS